MSAPYFLLRVGWEPPLPVSPAPVLWANQAQTFWTTNGDAWRYMGVSAFPLFDRWARGDSIQPFLDAFYGFNLLRVFDYVTWTGTGWQIAPIDKVRACLEYLRVRGWQVELVLLTDDDPARIPVAKDRVNALKDCTNLLFEVGNEPEIHKNIDTAALRDIVSKSGRLYCSGDSGESPRWYGNYLTAHTPRDSDWPRKAHDLFEYYHGGGPSSPNDPAHHLPCIGDEPIRPDTAVGFGYNTQHDYRAHFGTCSLLGGGGTFHYEGGKHCVLPTAFEAECAAESLRGMTAFDPIICTGAYRRIDEQGNTSRTYIVGNGAVRIRPKTLEFPEAGWLPMDQDGILWTRA